MSEWTGSGDPEPKQTSPWKELADALGCLIWVVAIALVVLLISVWDSLVTAVERWLQ